MEETVESVQNVVNERKIMWREERSSGREGEVVRETKSRVTSGQTDKRRGSAAPLHDLQIEEITDNEQAPS